MHIANIFRILGLFILFYSFTLLVPIIVSLLYKDGAALIFLKSAFCIGLFGLVLWGPTRKSHREVKPREGFLIVTLLWVLLCLCSTLPFILSNTATIIESVFESTSGLTTTGATVLVGLDDLPKSIVYFRQQLQFIGGGGVILFAIAILPLLGVGGMQLFRAEASGPFKEEKMTPRIAQTAKTLWFLYILLILLCAFFYWVFGMSLFDAICHSFATISTGGFSTHDSSFAYFQSPWIHVVAVFFMFLGAVNFSLHFMALRRFSFRHYWQDIEFKTFLIYCIIITLIITLTLWYYNIFEGTHRNLLQALFQVATFSSTTGFFSADYSKFPTFIPILLILISLIGGCAGSTAGGIKFIRAILMKKQAHREIERLIHPNGHYVIKLGYSRLNQRTLDAIWGFLGVYIATFCILLLLLLATGLDFLTAFSGLGAAVSSGGLGLGVISENFKPLNASAKLILSFAMLAGRLEFFTLLVLFSRSYWKN